MEEMQGAGGMVVAVQENISTALFVLLHRFPWADVTCTLAVAAIVLFFVTSSDSGSLVIDTITSGGHPHPPVAQRIYWALLEGVVAGVLLLGGGLQALQLASILSALPFSCLLLLLAWSLTRGLRQEYRREIRSGVLVDPGGED